MANRAGGMAEAEGTAPVSVKHGEPRSSNDEDGLGPPSIPSTGPTPGSPPRVPPEILLKMEDIVNKSGDRRWAVRKILRLGVLAGQRVEYRKSGNPVLTGTMTADGRVKCECARCEGRDIITCLAFEEHAKGYQRRPTDSMFILSTGQSIREFCFQGKDNPSNAERTANGQKRRVGRRRAHQALVTLVAQMEAAAAPGVPQEAEQPSQAKLSIPGELYPQWPQGVDAGQPLKHSGADGRDELHFHQSLHGYGAMPSPQQMGYSYYHGTNSWPGPMGVAPGMAGMGATGSLSAYSQGGYAYMSNLGDVMNVDHSTWRKDRNSNKHKRLFSGGPGCPLSDGEEVRYITAQQEVLRKGIVRINPNGLSGILCDCCYNIISCSTFEAHAGRGARRAPYDNIINRKGESLRELALLMPDEPSPIVQVTYPSLAAQAAMTGHEAARFPMPPVHTMYGRAHDPMISKLPDYGPEQTLGLARDG